MLALGCTVLELTLVLSKRYSRGCHVIRGFSKCTGRHMYKPEGIRNAESYVSSWKDTKVAGRMTVWLILVFKHDIRTTGSPADGGGVVSVGVELCPISLPIKPILRSTHFIHKSKHVP